MKQNGYSQTHITYIDDACLENKEPLSMRIEKVFLSVFDILKTTNGVDKFLRFFQYFSYIKQFKLKLMLKNKNIESN